MKLRQTQPDIRMYIAAPCKKRNTNNAPILHYSSTYIVNEASPELCDKTLSLLQCYMVSIAYSTGYLHGRVFLLSWHWWYPWSVWHYQLPGGTLSVDPTQHLYHHSCTCNMSQGSMQLYWMSSIGTILMSSIGTVDKVISLGPTVDISITVSISTWESIRGGGGGE